MGSRCADWSTKPPAISRVGGGGMMTSLLRAWPVVLSTCVACLVVLPARAAAAGAQHSLTIEVTEPQPQRPGNRMPATVPIDFRKIFGAADARVDPQSLILRPVKADGSDAGKPVPVRFDDPDPKPDSFHWAYMGGGGQAGDLVFQHEAGSEPVRRY